MFQSLQVAPPDPILGLNEAFRQDPNPQKINLSVGVYKDEHGKTPILGCIKEAERRLLAEESEKTYLPIDGNDHYGRLVRKLLLEDTVPEGRAVTVQTPGGTGALRVAADFLVQRVGAQRIWCSNPTWSNHPSVFEAAGLDVQQYAYLDSAGTGLDLDQMLASLQQAAAGDIICLHACCHNPTGVDPQPDQWPQIAESLQSRGLIPLVDCAYQGFGQGVPEDVAGLRVLQGSCPELLICSSYSKNFGLYGERVGALTLVAETPDAATAALSHVKASIRCNYSNPPRHGAALVALILEDATLRSQWLEELTAMRNRINGMRTRFVEQLQAAGVQRDFSFLTQQQGMFSYSGLTRLQVDQLRTEHSIYIVGSGRINVAGVTEQNIERLCNGIQAVL